MAGSSASLVPIRLRRLLGEPAHRRAGAERERDEGRLAQTLVRAFEEQGSGWFWQTDREGRITYLTRQVAERVHGDADAEGVPLAELFQTDAQWSENRRTLAFHLSSQTAFSDLPIHAVSGDTDRAWAITGQPRLDPLGHFLGFIGTGSDLTEKRRSEAEITNLALYDALTGLANRQRMKMTLEDTLRQSRTSYRSSSLLLLDLDRFKAVNDTLGHQTGDLLLQQVSQRLQRVVADAGLVGRLGGDEFQVLIAGEAHRERLSILAADIIQTLSQPYFLSGSSVSIGCSIGVAVAPEDGDTVDTLVRSADLALYAAKADGRGVHRFYRPEMLAGAQSRKQLEEDLRTALAQDELHVAYQPVVSTGAEPRIVGYEALLRWEHPVRGAISPADFVPVAEECGLIEMLGEWVLRTATAEAATWPGDVRVAVNVSAIQFANPALPGLVTSALASSGIAPGRLELEITESVFLTDSGASDAMFARLKKLGVRLALDDFGTGYSSLGYLRSAPFDKIKIDQSFVRGAITPGSRNGAIIQAIVTLAGTLGMETTAEGVEAQDEIELIRALGCTHIQGYVYGRPMPADRVREQLAKHAGLAAPVGHRFTRAPRVKTLRWAKLAIGAESGPVRIRNVSTTGALIDGLELPESAIGTRVMIELVDEQMFAASVRWARNGFAGLSFEQPFDLERMGPAKKR